MKQVACCFAVQQMCIFLGLLLLFCSVVYAQEPTGNLRDPDQHSLPVRGTEKNVMSYEETKKIENDIKRVFAETEEVSFNFFRGRHSVRCVVSEKRILAEFARYFRFVKPVSFTRIPNERSTPPGLLISVEMVAKGASECTFFASLPDIRVIQFTVDNGDSIDWCEAEVSTDFQMLFQYYFSEVIKKEFIVYNFPMLSLDDYRKNNYYNRSFLEDIENVVPTYSPPKIVDKAKE